MRIVGAVGLLLGIAAAAAGAAADTSAPDPRWRSFAATFEPGEHIEGSNVAALLPSALGSGRRGQALRLGLPAPSGTAQLDIAGVIDFAHPGALTCWVRPRGWKPPGGDSNYVPAVRVQGRGRAGLVVERDWRFPARGHDTWIVGFFALAPGRDIALYVDLPGYWENSEWHFLAVQWDATGFTFQLDDGPEIRGAVDGAALREQFPVAESRLMLGAPAPESFWIDDLAVWSRRLGRAEVEAIRSR